MAAEKPPGSSRPLEGNRPVASSELRPKSPGKESLSSPTRSTQPSAAANSVRPASSATRDGDKSAAQSKIAKVGVNTPSAASSATRNGETSAAPRSPIVKSSKAPEAGVNAPTGSPQTSSVVKLNLGTNKVASTTEGGAATVLNGSVRLTTAPLKASSKAAEGTAFSNSGTSLKTNLERTNVDISTQRGEMEGGARRKSPIKRPIETGQVSPPRRPAETAAQSGTSRSSFTTPGPQLEMAESSAFSAESSPRVQTQAPPRGSVSPTKAGMKTAASTPEAVKRTSASPTRVVAKMTTTRTETGGVRTVRSEVGAQSPYKVAAATASRSSAGVSPPNRSGFTVQSSKGGEPSESSHSGVGTIPPKKRPAVSFAESESGEEPLDGQSGDSNTSATLNGDVSKTRLTSASAIGDVSKAGVTSAIVNDDRSRAKVTSTGVNGDPSKTGLNQNVSVSAMTGGARLQGRQQNGAASMVERGMAEIRPIAPSVSTVKSAADVGSEKREGNEAIAPKRPGGAVKTAAESDEQFQARKGALLSRMTERAGLPFPKQAEIDTELLEGSGAEQQGGRSQSPVSKPAQALSAVMEETPRSTAALGATPGMEALGERSKSGAVGSTPKTNAPGEAPESKVMGAGPHKDALGTTPKSVALGVAAKMDAVGATPTVGAPEATPEKAARQEQLEKEETASVNAPKKDLPRGVPAAATWQAAEDGSGAKKRTEWVQEANLERADSTAAVKRPTTAVVTEPKEALHQAGSSNFAPKVTTHSVEDNKGEELEGQERTDARQRASSVPPIGTATPLGLPPGKLEALPEPRGRAVAASVPRAATEASVPPGSIGAGGRKDPTVGQSRSLEAGLEGSEFGAERKPVSYFGNVGVERVSKFSRLKTVLKVEERDLRFNRSGTLAAEKFEWLEVKRQAESGNELEAREDDSDGTEDELEAGDADALPRDRGVLTLPVRKSGQFVFESVELEGGKTSGQFDPPGNVQPGRDQLGINQPVDPPGGNQSGRGKQVPSDFEGVVRSGARAMEVKEPVEGADDFELESRESRSAGSLLASDLESGAEPVSARAARFGPFDDVEALDSPVARTVREGNLKVRTAAALGREARAARPADAKTQNGVRTKLEKLAETEAEPINGRASSSSGNQTQPAGKARRSSNPGESTEEEEQPLTGKELVLAAREYTGTNMVLSTKEPPKQTSNNTTDPQNPLEAPPTTKASASPVKRSRFAPNQPETNAPNQTAEPSLGARRPRTFASMGSLRDRDGKLKGMESVNVSRGGGQSDWAPGSPRTPLSEQNVRIEFLRTESRPLSPRIKMWSDIKERVASMLMFKSAKQKPQDESKRRILVIGGECSAGESTLRHLLIRGVKKFNVSFAVPCLESLQRSMTVDLASYHKRYYGELAQAGADRVEVNMLDERSLIGAMRGVWGVFYAEQWNLYDPEEEILRGKMVANAAFKAGVQHVVYSSSESVRDLQLAGLSRLERDPQWVVPHFDSKGDIEAYMVAIGLPATYVRVAPHYHELLDFCLFRTVGLGTLEVCLPMGSTAFPAISAADVGGCVMKIFEEPSQYSGLCIDLVGSYVPMSDYCKILSEHLGKNVVYRSVTPEWYRENAGYGHAASLANMYSFLREYPEYSMSHVDEAQALYPELQTFEDWMNGTTDVPAENQSDTWHLSLDIVRDDGLLSGSYAGKKAAFAELLELSDRNQRRTASRRWKNIKASVQAMPLMAGRSPAAPKAPPTRWKRPERTGTDPIVPPATPVGDIPRAEVLVGDRQRKEEQGVREIVPAERGSGLRTDQRNREERLALPGRSERPGLVARSPVPEIMDKPGLPALTARSEKPVVPQLMDKPGLPALMDRPGLREAPALTGRLALVQS